MTLERCPSSLSLDLVLLGAEDEPTRAHLACCPRCRARVEDLRRADAAFLTAGQVPADVAALAQRVNAARWGWRTRVAPALALAASLALAVIWGRSTPVAPVERAKGPTSVELWVERAGTVARFEAQPLAAGDTLAFRYTTSKRWLLVLDTEASGEVSAIVAREDGTSVPIEPGQNRTAPLGVKLDAYPGAERLIAVFSDAPLESGPLLAQLRDRLHALVGEAQLRVEVGPLEVDGDQASWLVEKGPR